MTPRTRIVNFRLTEQEYDQLKAAYLARGSRCLSDFARTTLLELTQPEAGPDESVHTRLVLLDEKISELGSGIYRLMRILEPEEPLRALRDLCASAVKATEED